MRFTAELSMLRATLFKLCLTSADTYMREPWLGGRERCVLMGLFDTYRINKAIAVLLTSGTSAVACRPPVRSKLFTVTWSPRMCWAATLG